MRPSRVAPDQRWGAATGTPWGAVEWSGEERWGKVRRREKR